MWRRWSKALEWFGRGWFRFGGYSRTQLRVGRLDTPDAQGSARWRDYLAADRLYDVWGPAPDSPWVAFHCVPLFAALDRIPRDHIGPAPAPEENSWTHPDPALRLPGHARPGATSPDWAESGAMIILDLPGPVSVEATVWLVTTAGCQPVCTFDNWPHPKGVLRSEDTLAELLRWASTVDDARYQIEPTAPPIWVCDNARLGTRKGRPGEFDNRYFLGDSILPGAAYLAKSGISRIIYVSPGADERATGGQELPLPDFQEYFALLLAAGIDVRHVDVMDPRLEPVALSEPITRRPLQTGDYSRSAAGGFGTLVPQPSSGGGG